MYPEKVTYKEKYNLRPIIEPDGQFSAEDANHLKEKINKNALFYDLHDNLAALQNKFPNPPIGAFAYLKDGSCYRCVGLGWTTDSGGGSGGSNYFYGYHLSLAKLEATHPKAKAGARAIIRISGGNDWEALWDEDDQRWFVFEFSDTGSSGSSTFTYLKSYTTGWQAGLTYHPYAEWYYNGVPYSETRSITLAAADATYDRIDLFVVNLPTGQVAVITGTPSANPEEPDYDPVTQLKGPFALIKAGATEPEGVNAVTIYAEGAAGEWEIPSTVGPSFDLASPNTPHTGAVCIEVVQPLTINQTLVFNAPASVPAADTELQYWIKNKTGGAHRWLIQGRRSNGKRDSQWIDAPANYDPISTAWQKLIIIIPASQLSDISAASLVAGFDGFEYFLDDGRLVSGTESVGGNYATIDYVDQQYQKILAEAKAYHDANSSGGSGSGVTKRYLTWAALLADQGTQKDLGIYYAADASGHSKVETAGTYAYFEYLGTTNGTEDDYRKLSEEESMDVAPSTVGSTIPISKTGTNILFTEDALYNEKDYLTTGDLILDFTGAVKGALSIVYCDRYIPQITGNYLITGTLSASKLNELWFFYNGTPAIDLMVINKTYLSDPNNATATAGDGQNTLSGFSTLNADSYDILFSTTNDINTTSSVPNYNGTDTMYTHTGLTNNTTYYYWIKAKGKGYIDSDYFTLSATPEAAVYLLSETFPGTTRDTAKWPINTASSDFTVTRNEKLIITDANTKSTGVQFVQVISSQSFSTAGNTVVLRFDFEMNPATKKYFRVGLRDFGAASTRFFAWRRVSSSEATEGMSTEIYENGSTAGNNNFSTLTPNNPFKIVVENQQAKFYMYDNGWVLHKTYSIVDANYQIEIARAASTIAGEKAMVDNIYVTDYDYTTLNP